MTESGSKGGLEIEARFLGIDKKNLIEALAALKATDHGENMLNEVIIYDEKLDWLKQGKFLRLRQLCTRTILSYKEHQKHTVDGTYEIEFNVGSLEKAQLLFEKIGFIAYRHQQKLRHTFSYKDVTIDIDTWPKIPPYVELEGESEVALKHVAQDLGLDWKNAVFENARVVIETRYNIPLSTLRWFTFDRME